jgi:hypothetical protein
VTGGHPKVWMVGVDGGMGEIPGRFVATPQQSSQKRNPKPGYARLGLRLVLPQTLGF